MGKIQFGVLLKTFAQWTTLGFIYMYNPKNMAIIKPVLDV